MGSMIEGLLRLGVAYLKYRYDYNNELKRIEQISERKAELRILEEQKQAFLLQMQQNKDIRVQHAYKFKARKNHKMEQVPCQNCCGSGIFLIEGDCRKCGGSGRWGEGECFNCDGSGWYCNEVMCNRCNGSKTKIVRVTYFKYPNGKIIEEHEPLTDEEAKEV